ncbi:MAG: hypothetical protein ACYTGC_18210 [Planctomycetota bacterium]
MWYVSALLFACGFAAYVVALLNMGSSTGETYSDVANACMLLSIALAALWHLRPWRREPAIGG